ncbi:MAG: helix-turn-helix domain-containing protein [Firmicutes bacterium]|nr:helix-turn-helix domain-containing protein [Bacillota bacterium]
MRKFAERLKELRLEKELSIAMLSKELKLGVASICRWENNQSDAKGDQILIIAKFFNVSSDYLLGLED